MLHDKEDRSLAISWLPSFRFMFARHHERCFPKDLSNDRWIDGRKVAVLLQGISMLQGVKVQPSSFFLGIFSWRMMFTSTLFPDLPYDCFHNQAGPTKSFFSPEKFLAGARVVMRSSLLTKRVAAARTPLSGDP
jgi:hypothetical protein